MSHRRSDARCCGSRDCAARDKREYYNRHEREIACKYCGEGFQGKGKVVACATCLTACVDKRPKQTFVRVLVCPRCGVKTGENVGYVNGRQKESSKGKVCEPCHQAAMEGMAERMRLENPLYEAAISQEEYEARKAVAAQAKADRKEGVRRRMRENNPMHKVEVRNRVSSTFRSKIASGEITYASGPDHHLYRGNRSLNMHVRAALADWFKRIKARDDFTCVRCATRGGVLHTHHVEPLRDIIARHNPLGLKGKVGGMDPSDVSRLVASLVRYHEENDAVGMTLCHECHGKVDGRYRRKVHARPSNQTQAL